MGEDRNQKNGNNSPFPVIILLLILLLVALGIALGFHRAGQQQQSADSKSSAVQEEETGAEQEKETGGSEENQSRQTEAAGGKAMVLDVSDVVEETMPSVVAITNRSVQEVSYMFRGTVEVESESTGSGIIISQTEDELLIATNYHVVEDASTLTVCFTVEVEEEEDAIAPAVVKGSDEQYDLAVVAVALEDIPREVMDQILVAKLGSSEDLVVGEPAIAIGNALGYGQSVTLGIVSALDRMIDVDGMSYSYIQTDAAINFGNSGGALLNTEGEVIGINSAKAAYSGVEGMGYAIPIDDAEPILAELMNRETREKLERTEQGYLGVYTQDISAEARSLYSIPNGVFITYVEDDSPAEAAGLQRGDIISSMDGLAVTSVDRFEEIQEFYRSGETIQMEILRADKGNYVSKDVNITFSEQPEQNGRSSGREGYSFYRGSNG